MKIILTILIAFATLDVGAEQIPVTYPGVQRIIRSNEGTGTSVASISSTTAYYGNVGVGGTWVTGKYGSALSNTQSGRSSDPSHLVGSAAGVPFRRTGGSIVFWAMRPQGTALATQEFLIWTGLSPYTGQIAFYIYTLSGNLITALNKNGITSVNRTLTGGVASFVKADGVWRMYVLNWGNSLSGTTSKTYVFTDTTIYESEAKDFPSGTIDATEPGFFTTGGFVENATYTWRGIIDETAIFDHALSMGEMKRLYQMGRDRNYVNQGVSD